VWNILITTFEVDMEFVFLFSIIITVSPFFNVYRIMNISPFDDFIGLDRASQFSYQSKQLYMNDLENFNFDFNLPNLDESSLEVDQKPFNVVLPEMGHYTDKGSIAESGFVEASKKTGNQFVSFVNKQEKWENQEPLSLTLSAAESGFVEASAKTESGFVDFVKKEVEGENQKLPLPLPSSSTRTSIIRKRSISLQFDDIRKHFDVPLKMAAKKMNVGVTLLKNRCRELNITRWPHRKLRSLTVLIDNLKVYSLCCLTSPHIVKYFKIPNIIFVWIT
jgi:hypothetical protein